MVSKIMSEMTWEEYAACVPKGFVILPVGSTEQHSRHLPLGVDSIITGNIARALAQDLPAVVAPTIDYGYKSQPSSGGGPLFPGTIDLNGSTLVNMTYDILKEFLADGWNKVLVLNGHFENQAFLLEAADLLLRGQKEPFPKIVVTSWWDNMSERVLPLVFDELPFAGWELEHAAIVETSAMMYFAPHLVHEERFLDEGLDRIPRHHTFPVQPELLPASGNLHSPRSSSAKKGEIIVRDVIQHLKLIVEKEFS